MHRGNELMKKMNIGTKLVLAGVIVVIVPLLSVAIIGVGITESALTDSTKEQMVRRAEQYAELIDTVFESELRFAAATASSPAIVSAALSVSESGADASSGKTAEADAVLTSMNQVKA